MPMIDLYAPPNLLPPAALATLADRILEMVHEAEGYAGSALAAALSWTYVHEMPEGALRVGFEPCPSPVWRVEIAAPEGSIPAAARPRLARDIARLVLTTEGGRFHEDEARRVWTLFRDVPDQAWFAGAHSGSAAAIRRAVERERSLPAA